ncbi:TonB-dependent receptor [Flavobacterium sp.]
MKIIYIYLLVGFAMMANAQNKIVGTVTDNSKNPIPNAIVSLPEINKETNSDVDGKFTLTNLPNGKFKLVVSFMGYETQTKIVTLSGNELQESIILNDAITHMDEVIVSNIFKRLQSQNVMKVEQESIKSLQQKGTATLIEGLATIPGVSQVSTGTSIGKPVIRGLSGNRVLVYSQGVRLENQQFGEEHGLGLNDSGVESVEVIKGPASLLYGSDALGGVLYFNPEKFANPNAFTADLNQRFFSNTLGSNTSLGIKTSTNKWKFLVRGNYNTHSDYEVPDGDRVTNTRFNEKDLKAGIGYSNSNFSSVFRYNFNQLDLGIPEDGIAEQSTSKKTMLPSQGVDSHILSLHNTVFFKNSKLDVDLGYIYNDRKEFAESYNPVLHMKLKTFNYTVNYHLPKKGKFETIIGTQGMNQTNSNFGQELLIPNAKTNDFGIYTTSIYEWGKNVLQAGIRYDNRKITSENHGILGDEGYFAAIAKSFDSFNASLGYKTNLAEPLTIRLNFATGFRAPNLAELTSNGVHEGSNRYEIGNANLKNEQNFQTDLNLEYKSSHFEWFVNGFYNHINNYIFISPSGTQIASYDVYDYVQNDAHLFGGEVGLHFHPHPLDWLHLLSSFETVTAKKDNGDNLPLIPANKWNNTLRAEFEKRSWLQDGFATLNIVYTLVQNNFSQFETKTSDYTLINLGFGGEITFNKSKFNLNLNANNLLDKTYISNLSRLKTDGIPNIGRNVILGVNFAI